MAEEQLGGQADGQEYEEITSDEDAWLRRTLREHLDRTGSPRAARLLSRRGRLPMVRVTEKTKTVVRDAMVHAGLIN